MRLTYCIPCQYGDHTGHYEVVQAVPKGMMGGAKCPCRGECAEHPSRAAAFESDRLETVAPSAPQQPDPPA